MVFRGHHFSSAAELNEKVSHHGQSGSIKCKRKGKSEKYDLPIKTVASVLLVREARHR